MILERRRSNESEAITWRPRVSEGHAEAVVDLFERDSIAVEALVAIALDPLWRRKPGERFPYADVVTRTADSERGYRPCLAGEPVELIVGEVRKKTMVFVDASRGQGSVA